MFSPPAALRATLDAALATLDLTVLVTETATGVRDALYDQDVAVVLVHFGRDAAQGCATCRTIRKHPSGEKLPLIALIDDAIATGFPLDCGVDDFLVVPCSPAAAALRVRLVLWRQDDAMSLDAVKVGDMVIDPAAMTVRLKGVPVDLTYKEFELLRYFISNPGLALHRTQILATVWGDDYFGGDRTVDIHVRRLRAKLPPLEGHIDTVHGVGYRFSMTVGA